MKQWLNFRVGKLISRSCRNNIHNYEFYAKMKSEGIDRVLFIYRCKICGDRTTRDQSGIWDKKTEKLIPLK